ncbi:MAG: ABC transporter permease [Candidatus Heimdallarchaeota archaeon]|nr:ABC transporter permease [Candidatus Heimdallarchaeota archaeon]
MAQISYEESGSSKDSVVKEEKVHPRIKITKRNISQSQWRITIERLQKNRVAVIAFYYIGLNILIAFIYPILMGFNPVGAVPGHDRRFGGGANAFPSLKYPGGTDLRGMDSFARVLSGSETSLTVGILSTIIALLIGVVVGLYAGYYQGKTEEILMRITDLFLAVPFLIIALILLRLVDLGQADAIESLTHVQIITILIGLFGWAGLARLVTANVKQVTALEYIDAVKIMGANNRRILFVHIFPNVLPPIIVLGALFVAGGILAEAGLAFLGFADPTNTVSWGIQVNLARPKLNEHPEQALIPGFAIFFLVLCVNLFGDGLRDALDPRLKE